MNRLTMAPQVTEQKKSALGLCASQSVGALTLL